MTTCTVEAINAAWTALAFLSGSLSAILLGYRWQKWITEDLADKAAAAAVALACAVAISTGFHAYGQDALRYVAAEMSGAHCLYDNKGNVTVVGICPAPDPEPTKGEK